jgi:LysM repeat protein
MVAGYKFAVLAIVGFVLFAFPTVSYGAASAASPAAANSPRNLERDVWLMPATAAVAVKCPTIYAVRYGETLSSIAARCGVSAAALKSANGLRTTRVWPGQRLYIPSPVRTAPAPQPTPAIHRAPAP